MLQSWKTSNNFKTVDFSEASNWKTVNPHNFTVLISLLCYLRSFHYSSNPVIERVIVRLTQLAFESASSNLGKDSIHDTVHCAATYLSCYITNITFWSWKFHHIAFFFLWWIYTFKKTIHNNFQLKKKRFL